MSKSIRQLFEATRVANFAPGLEQQVLARLEQEQKKLAKRNLLVFGLVDALSVTGLVSSFLYLINLMANSSFYNYLSLLWSDTSSVGLFWHELLLSLIESLPVIGVVAFLGVSLAFLLSISKTITNFTLLSKNL